MVHHFLSVILVVVVAALGLSLLVYQFLTGVPSMSASSAEIADVVALLKSANLAQDVMIYELGCGWGAMTIALALAFPDARIHGIEVSPFPYWVARLRTRHLRNVTLQRANFYRCDLRDAQAVTCYLMTKSMPKLANFLDSTIKPGTPVVALTFWFRNRQVTESREGPGIRGPAALYFWPATQRIRQESKV